MTWSADEAIPHEYARERATRAIRRQCVTSANVPTPSIEQRILRRNVDGFKTAEIRYFSTITAVLSLTLAGSVPVAFTPGFSET